MRFNAIGNGRFSSLLTRLLWVKSGDAAAPSLADEITPVLDVGSADDASLHYLRNERLAGAFASVAPAAGNFGNITLVNPAGSNVLCVVQGFTAYRSAATYLYEIAETGYTSTTIPSKVANFREMRWGQQASAPTCGVRTFSDMVDPNTTPQYSLRVIRLQAGVELVQPVKIVLPPGGVYRLVNGTAAANFEASFTWMERPIGAEELSTG